MPICSYLVLPEAGAVERVADALGRMPECEVVPALNRDVLLLVTETSGLEEEETLRRRVESMDGVEALVLTFGEIDPDSEVGDPLAVGRRARQERPGPSDPASAVHGSREDAP